MVLQTEVPEGRTRRTRCAERHTLGRRVVQACLLSIPCQVTCRAHIAVAPLVHCHVRCPLALWQSQQDGHRTEHTSHTAHVHMQLHLDVVRWVVGEARARRWLKIECVCCLIFKNARETRSSLLVAQKTINGGEKSKSCLLFASTGKNSGQNHFSDYASRHSV